MNLQGTPADEFVSVTDRTTHDKQVELCVRTINKVVADAVRGGYTVTLMVYGNESIEGRNVPKLSAEVMKE